MHQGDTKAIAQRKTEMQIKQDPKTFQWILYDDDGQPMGRFNTHQQAFSQQLLHEYSGLSTPRNAPDAAYNPPEVGPPGGKLLNHLNPEEIIDLHELHNRASAVTGAPRNTPENFIKGYRTQRDIENNDPGLVIPSWPVHGQAPMATSPAEYRAHQQDQRVFDNGLGSPYENGYYVGPHSQEPQAEINRANRAIQLEEGADAVLQRSKEQAAAEATKSKPQEVEDKIDFLDEVAKTFKLTSDPAAKSDISSKIGKPQYVGESAPRSQAPKKRNPDEDQAIAADQLKRGMIRERDTKLYSPPGLKTDMTPPPGSERWNAAQWDAYHAKMSADQMQAQYNQQYQLGHQTATQQAVSEAQNSPQMRQWRDFNDTSGPAPGQNIQEWALHRLQQNGGFGEAYQNSPMPQNAPGMNAGQPGVAWAHGPGKVYIDQYGRERTAEQHSSDESAMQGAGQPTYVPGRTQGAIVAGQSGSAQSLQQAQQQGEAYYRHQRYGNRGWDLGDMMHGATGGLIGDKMRGPAQGQSEQDWEAQQDAIARQNMYSDPREKGDMHAAPASREVDGFLDSLAKSYATYKYKEPDKEPTDQPTGGRYMGVMAPSVAASPTGQTLVKKDAEGLEYLDEKPSLSAALAALGRLHERLNALEGKKRV